MSKTTGPYALASGVAVQFAPPDTDLYVAFELQNNSPYQLTIYISQKEFTLAPWMQEVFDKPSTVRSISAVPSTLSGTVPAGANSDATLTWYTATDDISVLKFNHPVALTPNTISSGSTITGNVDVTAPLTAGGAVEVSEEAVATANVSTVASSASSQELSTGAPANTRGLLLANGSSALALVAFGSAASATNFSVALASGATVVVRPAYTGAIYVIWPTAGTGNVTATYLTD